MQETSIAIIGGGLAGTYLAYLLEQQGIDYCLLEAKPTLGGRIFSQTHSSQNDSLQMDLGPTWFWPHQKRLQTLLQELNIPYFQQYIKGDALYQTAANKPVQRSSGSDGILSYRVHGGMQILITTLAKKLHHKKILLSHPINTIEKVENAWHIKSSSKDKTILAKKLVIAIPPRVLVQNIETKQWLPENLHTAFLSTPTWMAAQAKFIATYKEAFWRQDNLSGDAFSHVGPMIEIHDASAESDSAYALFGFLGIPAALRTQAPEKELQQLCLQQLAMIFGPKALETEKIYFKDWAKDEFVCTVKDINGAAMHPNLYLDTYKQTLDEINLHFTGTEYATEEAGYLEGALASSENVFNIL